MHEDEQRPDDWLDLDELEKHLAIQAIHPTLAQMPEFALRQTQLLVLILKELRALRANPERTHA